MNRLSPISMLLVWFLAIGFVDGQQNEPSKTTSGDEAKKSTVELMGSIRGPSKIHFDGDSISIYEAIQKGRGLLPWVTSVNNVKVFRPGTGVLEVNLNHLNPPEKTFMLLNGDRVLFKIRSFECSDEITPSFPKFASSKLEGVAIDVSISRDQPNKDNFIVKIVAKGPPEKLSMLPIFNRYAEEQKLNWGELKKSAGKQALGQREIQLQGKKDKLIRILLTCRVPRKKDEDVVELMGGSLHFLDIGDWWPAKLE